MSHLQDFARPRPILLGHNPFFGVNHLSQESGNEKAKTFEDTSKVIDILKHCHGLGVRGMMMSTHPRAASIAAAVAEMPELQREWLFYPLVPYIQKYVRGSNEKGLSNLILETLGQATLGQKLSLIFRGGKGLLTRDVREALCLLVDIELMPLKKVNFGAVFLHDTLTDLAIGLGLESLLELFRNHVQKNYGVPGAFITKNLPLFCQAADRLGWENPWVMASHNARGFYVNPSLPKFEETLNSKPMTFFAMNSLASGAIPPSDAYRYLGQFKNLSSVVVGVSRKDHADGTISAIRENLPCARG